MGGGKGRGRLRAMYTFSSLSMSPFTPRAQTFYLHQKSQKWKIKVNLTLNEWEAVKLPIVTRLGSSAAATALIGAITIQETRSRAINIFGNLGGIVTDINLFTYSGYQ